MRPPFLALLALTVLVVPGFAKVWKVGGPDADFSQIQPAIAAAQDGDVILVRFGTYDSFTLDKGVIVSGSPTFLIGKQSSPVEVKGIAAGKKGGVAGMNFEAGWIEPARLNVHDCSGEVLLVEIIVNPTAPPSSWSEFGPFPDGNAVRIAHCDNVAITGMAITRGLQG